MDFVEKSAKTVDDAIIEALKELGVKYDEVDVEIVDHGSKGFLGIGSKNAVVRVKKKFDPSDTARFFLEEVFKAMQMAVSLNVEMKDHKHMAVNLSGDNMGVLIGKRGQTLDSLQYLVNLVVNKTSTQYISITLDTENYRQRRKDTLETLAHNLAKKVKATRKSVVLEPMSPYERRIIHSALQNDRYVTTHSQGEEPFRNIVITLK